MSFIESNSQTSVTLSLLNESNFEEFTNFLYSLPDSLIYYSLSFRFFLEDLLTCECEYWLARESGEITGILPLMWRTGPYGRVINSLPFYGSNGGVLATTQASTLALTRKYNELVSATDVVAATWICHPQHENITAPAHNLTDQRIGQSTDLNFANSQLDGLYEIIDNSARRNIRKSESSGIQVSVQNNRLDFLKQVHQDNILSIGGLPKSPSFFEKFPIYLKPNRDFKLYIAERNNAPVAALLLLYFNQTVEYYIPATVESERIHQPTAALIRTAMLEAASDGFKFWNWGGTWLSQTGVWRFKNKWGAKNRPYKYYIKARVENLRNATKEQLLHSYPGFYVIPFDQLTRP